MPDGKRTQSIRDAFKNEGLVLTLSSILCLSVLITVMVHRDAASMGTYSWTNRKVVRNFDYIVANYTDWGIKEGSRPIHANNSMMELLLLQQMTYRSGSCYPVTMGNAGGNSIEWEGPEVSPLCNCLRNMHMEFSQLVMEADGVTIRNATDMKSSAHKQNRTKFTTRLEQQCLAKARPTQVESLSKSRFRKINVYALTLLWNIIATMMVQYGLWVDVEKKPSNDALAFHAVVSIFSFISTVCMFWIDSQWFPAVASLVFHLWFWAQMLWSYSEKVKWQHRKAVVFWTGYGIVFPVVLSISNALLQRRDTLFNVICLVLGATVGISSMVSDYWRDAVKRREAGNKVVNDNERVQGTVSLFVWIYNAVLVVAVLGVSAPGFTSSPFSNATSLARIAALLIGILPLTQTNYLLGKCSIDKQDTDATPKLTYMFWLEFATRMIFSVAVIMDVISLRHVDNVPRFMEEGL